MIVALALASGIPPAAWRAEDERIVVTAIQLLQEEEERRGRKR